MKKMFALLLFFGCIAFLMPYSWLLLTTAYEDPTVVTDIQSIPSQEQSETATSTSDDTNGLEINSEGDNSNSPPSTEPIVAKHSEFYIYCIDRDGVLTVPVKEYIIGAIAAEMPLTYPIEALKAQAVAAYSYAAARAENRDSGDSPMNSDFTANPSKYEGFLTENELQNIWGNSYEENYSFLSDIVDEVAAVTLTYEDETALSCYFPLSNGNTLPSSSVFGVDLPYLISVDSPYDVESIEFEQKITFTTQQIFDVLTSNFVDTKLGEDPTEWFSNPNFDGYDHMTDITAGGVIISGEELRASLGLRSTSMEIEYADNVFIFTTKGIGHGVGMSQFGAKRMAENGYTYDVILQYYYPGTKLSTS